ncbi:hypothetical protein C3747_55g116 [Trypanosoma cruzi]|uniref:Glucose-methanol-choline oxidoreductase N-terminal domain-containing protein n=1 Tax=Trypanosoma cruzi TaxID=5693 RepID=A0A2V2WTQ4_TRYCR|nr:hypothetical protein C3747_55g116 [Trypanosoma cruzi]RNC49087.1 hypothetical protein TcCL_NonESM00918 [Trypanosoma cruzi]
MLFAWILTILALFVSWLWNVRLRSSNSHRPYKVLHKPIQDLQADFVVVGAGPGGLAASKCLIEHEKECLVLVIERGMDPSPAGPFPRITGVAHRHNLLSYAVESVGSKLDSGWYVEYPLRYGRNEGDDDVPCSVAPYPRGCAVGGTSNMDWALYFPPVPAKVGLKPIEAVIVPHAFAVSRNPLSWGFAESAGAVLKRKHLSSFSEPYMRNSVFPGLLRIDKYGCRLSLSHHLMSQQSPSFSILEGCEVTGFSFDDKGTVTSVQCRSVDSQIFKVIVRKGVILSAGVIGTARIIRQVFPKLQEHFFVRDSIALPLIFRARPGISDDRRNLRSFTAQIMWWVARRGPFLNAVCDTLAVVDLPSLGSRAELVVFLLPFGGRDPTLYRRLGLDRILGMFAEGFMMFLTLRGVDGACFELSAESPGKEVERRKEFHPLFDRVISFPASTMSPSTLTNVVAAFMDGIQLCRKIVAEPPLAHFSTGQEAVDVTLCADPTRAVQYVQLMRKPPSKLKECQRASAPALLAWAKESSRTPAYMEAYIRRHAIWFGFGSGSCAASLANGDESFRVSGTQNMFIGDCSGVTEKMWRAGGGDTLSAGSVSTAMALGNAAAMELLSL